MVKKIQKLRCSDNMPQTLENVSDGHGMEISPSMQELQAELKKARAELKIHQDAWAAEADKYAALSAQAGREQHDLQATKAQLAHVLKLIRTAEDTYYEGITTQNTFDMDGWRTLYQKLVRAVQLVFAHRS